MQLFTHVYHNKELNTYESEGYAPSTYDQAYERLEDYLHSWKRSGFEYAWTYYEDLTIDGSLKKIRMEFGE